MAAALGCLDHRISFASGHVVRSTFIVLCTLPALLIGCAAPAPPPDALERAWLAAFAPLQAQVEAERLPLRVQLVAVPHRHTSPSLMRSSPRECTLIIAVRGNALADYLLRGFDPSHRPALIRAVLAHEVGHCRDHLTNPAGWAARRPAQPSKPGHPVGTREGEALADVYALAWTARYFPDDYAVTVRFFRAMRSMPGLNDGAHAVGAWTDDPERVRQLAQEADPLSVARHVVQGRMLLEPNAATPDELRVR